MYNRYVPQEDGGFACVPVTQEPCRSAADPPPKQQRSLLGGFDTDDLLILLILFLILRDDGSDTMTALIAIAAFILL